jgi:hypothetical protein
MRTFRLHTKICCMAGHRLSGRFVQQLVTVSVVLNGGLVLEKSTPHV